MRTFKVVIYGQKDDGTLTPIKIDDDGYIIIKEYVE